ncbi:MAG: UDP-2,3-diacylglucosamine diphosphatase LpxI [Alphaproteobacteria bacterium]
MMGMTSEISPLAIIAGGGLMPRRLAEAARLQGYAVHILAIKDQADPALTRDFNHDWIDLRSISQTLALLRKKEIKKLIFAGKVKRPSFTVLLSDPWTAKFFAKAGLRAISGDDGLLSALIKVLEESEGFQILGIDQILKDLAAPLGCLTQHQPDLDAEMDIQRGVSVALALGKVDVGQAVVVQQGLVLGVESIEGTAALLERCIHLKRDGAGGVLVKISKPGQERRADLPTIGLETIHQAVVAGLRGIAVEAQNSLIIDRQAVIQAADKAGLFLIGISV